MAAFQGRDLSIAANPEPAVAANEARIELLSGLRLKLSLNGGRDVHVRVGLTQLARVLHCLLDGIPGVNAYVVYACNIAEHLAGRGQAD